MLLWQGVAAFKLYTGQDMPVEDVRNYSSARIYRWMVRRNALTRNGKSGWAKNGSCDCFARFQGIIREK